MTDEYTHTRGWTWDKDREGNFATINWSDVRRCWVGSCPTW